MDSHDEVFRLCMCTCDAYVMHSIIIIINNKTCSSDVMYTSSHEVSKYIKYIHIYNQIARKYVLAREKFAA